MILIKENPLQWGTYDRSIHGLPRLHCNNHIKLTHFQYVQCGVRVMLFIKLCHSFNSDGLLHNVRDESATHFFLCSFVEASNFQLFQQLELHFNHEVFLVSLLKNFLIKPQHKGVRLGGV